MDPWMPARPFALTEIARTGDRFADFAPYVAAMADSGDVVFQATLPDGGSGIFAGDGAPVAARVNSDEVGLAAVTSHPDVNARGDECFFAQTRGGATCLCRRRSGGLVAVVAGDGLVRSAGPLGPTINAEGTVAFRGMTATGRSAVFVNEGDSARVVAEAGASFADFRGLPIATRRGAVFLADVVGGGQALCAQVPESGLITLTDTRGEFAAMGNFPAANEDGLVVFAARWQRGGGGVFVVDASSRPRALVSGPGFESYRGALISDVGGVVFFATPDGGTLGIYRGPDPREHRVLGVGDAYKGSVVAEFALNPVSINTAGQLAIRVHLEDGRGLILRADPM